MMQKVRSFSLCFFLLVWVVSFLFQLSLAVLFLLRYKFVLFYHLYLGGRMFYFMLGCVLLYMVGHLFYYG
uniref:Uncharacterized protein n=1 Tax=Anguilla anguilla TaxID=7936 RepID=A0A0E9W5A6_ANGAN